MWNIKSINIFELFSATPDSPENLRFWEVLRQSMFNFRLFRKPQSLYTLKGGFDWKTVYFDPCIKILIVGNFQKKNITFDVSWFSNSYLSKNTGFISCIKVSIKKYILVEDDSNAKLVVFLLAASFSMKLLKSFKFWLASIFNLIFSCNY